MAVNIRVKFLDPSKPVEQQAVAQFYIVKDLETTTFRDIFLHLCHLQLFPSELSEAGLQTTNPIYVYGANSFDTTAVQDCDTMIGTIFGLIPKVTCVEFRINVSEIAADIPTTPVIVNTNKSNYSMFLTPTDREQFKESELKKQRLCNTERPMTREEYRSADDVKESTPNLDRAWDIVCDWLVTQYLFGCDATVKWKPSHLMYEFIKSLSLLLLQISPRWTAIWKEMTGYQQIHMRDKKILNVLFSDESFLTPRIVYINEKTPRKKFHQDDCDHLNFALDTLLKYKSPIFQIIDDSLLGGLQELQKVVLTRSDYLTKQSTRTAMSREAQSRLLIERGVEVLHELGSLVVILIAGDSIGVGSESVMVRQCHERLLTSVANLEPWDFLPLSEFEPDDRKKRAEYFNTSRFFLGYSPFVLLKHTSNDRSQRNIHFYLRLPHFDRLENIQQIQGYKTAFSSIKQRIPLIVSRHAKMYIQDCIRETVGGNALQKRILGRFLLPRDGSSHSTDREEALEKVELLKMAGELDPDAINDLRSLNGSNVQFEKFYEICDILFEEAEQHASSSRHGSDMIESNEISSISEFWRMASKRANDLCLVETDRIKIPTLNHFQMQFLPPNRCSKTGEKYIGRFKYNLLVQRNCIHSDHPDFDHTEANTLYVQHWLCEVLVVLNQQQHRVLYIETDDKNKINVCEKGYVLSAHQKPARVLTKRLGANASKDKGTADHDAGGSLSKLIPTVYLIPDLEVFRSPSDSLFTGKILVSVHDSILSPSTALRARVNLHKVIKDYGNDPAIVIVKSDGGPEQNFQHMSVCTAIVAGFFHSDLDVLVMIKSCPGNSWRNPIERCMSILNHALVGAVITRPYLTNTRNEKDLVLEQQFSSCSTQHEIRDKAARNPDFKDSCVVCFEELSKTVEARFVRKATFKGEAIGVVEQATISEHEFFLTSLGRIDQSLPIIIRTSSKGLSDSQIPALMKPFLDSDHVIKRTYSIQFWKKCWHLAANKAIENGEDPNNLEADACKDCPWGCTRPKIPLSDFASLCTVIAPQKQSLTVAGDLDTPVYLSYDEAKEAIANGSRKDIEQLPKKMSSAQVIQWKVVPLNAAGNIMSKHQILAKDRVRGCFRCTKCGKPRGIYTIKVFPTNGHVHVNLEEFLALVGRLNHCGYDLTESAKNFGITDDFLPYTRLTSGNIALTCSHKVEDVLYAFDQCQNICNVCGSSGVILAEGNSKKPLCELCKNRGWPEESFKSEQRDCHSQAIQQKASKVDKRKTAGSKQQLLHFGIIKHLDVAGKNDTTDSQAGLSKGASKETGNMQNFATSSLDVNADHIKLTSPELVPLQLKQQPLHFDKKPAKAVINATTVASVDVVTEQIKLSVAELSALSNIIMPSRTLITNKDIAGKRWNLKLSGRSYVRNSIEQKIKAAQENNTFDHEFLFQNSFSTCTYYAASKLLNRDYIDGDVIDLFVALSNRFKASDTTLSVRSTLSKTDTNPHREALTTESCTYLETSFYTELVGTLIQKGKREMRNNVLKGGYSRNNVAYYTSKYIDSSYLRQTIIMGVHRPAHWIGAIILPIRKLVVIIDPFKRDSGKDVGANLIKWYNDEVYERFPSEFQHLVGDTVNWKSISAGRSTTGYVINTPLQVDGYSCAPITAMILYYFIMYGRLPNLDDFSCDSIQVKEIRLFMLYEIDRLNELPEILSVGEIADFNAKEEAHRIRKDFEIEERKRKLQAGDLKENDIQPIHARPIVGEEDEDIIRFNQDAQASQSKELYEYNTSLEHALEASAKFDSAHELCTIQEFNARLQVAIDLSLAVLSPKEEVPVVTTIAGTRNTGQKRGLEAGLRLLPMILRTDNSSADTAEFSQQSFSHLECNKPPFVEILERGRATNFLNNVNKTSQKKQKGSA